MIHEKGAKAKRDRGKIMGKYQELCRYMRVKPLPAEKLAKMSNQQFYQLCEDTFNRQPEAAKTRYAEAIGAIPRQNPFAFKWFLADLMHIKRPRTPLGRFWITLQAPFRYPAALARKKKRAKESARLEQVAMKMYPGLSAKDALAKMQAHEAEIDAKFAQCRADDKAAKERAKLEAVQA